VRDPLKDWTREDTTLADTFSIQDPGVDRTGFGRKFVEVGQPGVAAHIARGVDDGLDAHRPPIFEVLLDAGVLVEDVDHHAAVVAAVDSGAEGALGVAADAAVKDDLHVVGAPEVEVVGDQRFEEPAGVAGCVKDEGAGELDLAHGGLPPVAGVAVGVGERLR
jgi:hypothetical protein